MNKTVYNDVLEEIKKYATPRVGVIKHADKYIDNYNNVFLVNNKPNGVLFQKNTKDYKETINIVRLLFNEIGGHFEIQPVVKSPNNIKTCDFKWMIPGQDQYHRWDLKTVEGNSKRTLDNMIKNMRNQSLRFIFDLKNKSMTKEEATIQIKKILGDKQRNWIESIILIDNNKILFMYKKMRPHPANAE